MIDLAADEFVGTIPPVAVAVSEVYGIQRSVFAELLEPRDRVGIIL